VVSSQQSAVSSQQSAVSSQQSAFTGKANCKVTLNFKALGYHRFVQEDNSACGSPSFAEATTGATACGVRFFCAMEMT